MSFSTGETWQQREKSMYYNFLLVFHAFWVSFQLTVIFMLLILPWTYKQHMSDFIKKSQPFRVTQLTRLNRMLDWCPTCPHWFCLVSSGRTGRTWSSWYNGRKGRNHILAIIYPIYCSVCKTWDVPTQGVNGPSGPRGFKGDQVTFLSFYLFNQKSSHTSGMNNQGRQSTTSIMKIPSCIIYCLFQSQVSGAADWSGQPSHHYQLFWEDSKVLPG